jgi:hypothetical protein
MRFWPRRLAKTGHIGIVLRISIPEAGIVFQATSDDLHHIACFGEASVSCLPDCLPGCQKHGWTDIFNNPPGITQPSVHIEARPITLPDY